MSKQVIVPAIICLTTHEQPPAFGPQKCSHWVKCALGYLDVRDPGPQRWAYGVKADRKRGDRGTGTTRPWEQFSVLQMLTWIWALRSQDPAPPLATLPQSHPHTCGPRAFRWAVPNPDWKEGVGQARGAAGVLNMCPGKSALSLPTPSLTLGSLVQKAPPRRGARTKAASGRPQGERTSPGQEHSWVHER